MSYPLYMKHSMYTVNEMERRANTTGYTISKYRATRRQVDSVGIHNVAHTLSTLPSCANECNTYVECVPGAQVVWYTQHVEHNPRRAGRAAICTSLYTLCHYYRLPRCRFLQIVISPLCSYCECVSLEYMLHYFTFILSDRVCV
jgi:hypothetical protein